MRTHRPAAQADGVADAALRPSAAQSALDALGHTSWYVALAVAWTAMCGSLFFSEVLGWLPCVLCWYQRILMYPLAVLIAVGLLRGDRQLYWYVLPFSTLGAGVSVYHYLLVKTDWLPPPPCVAGIPCTVEYLNWLGFINIPFLALTAFVLISFLAIVSVLGGAADASDAATDSDDRAPGSRMHGVARLARVAVIVAVVVGSFWVAARFV